MPETLEKPFKYRMRVSQAIEQKLGMTLDLCRELDRAQIQDHPCKPLGSAVVLGGTRARTNLEYPAASVSGFATADRLAFFSPSN